MTGGLLLKPLPGNCEPFLQDLYPPYSSSIYLYNWMVVPVATSIPVSLISLNSWKGSCAVCTSMDLPFSLDSSGRIFGMAPRASSPSPSSQLYGQLCESPQPKYQFIKVVHVEVAKEHEGIAADLVCKTLHSTTFRCTTNLMMKLVPLYSDCTIWCNKRSSSTPSPNMPNACLAMFEHVSNPHIDCLDECTDLLSNHSLCLIALSYWINQKARTFLSLDHDHSTGQVMFTYPCKYWGVAKHITWWNLWSTKMAFPPSLVELCWHGGCC